MIGKDFVWKLSDEQYEKLSEWYEKLIEEKHGGNRNFGPIGGELAFEVIPTSIGIFAKAMFDGSEIDLSEI
jgi:hypothetical protein